MTVRQAIVFFGFDHEYRSCFETDFDSQAFTVILTMIYIKNNSTDFSTKKSWEYYGKIRFLVPDNTNFVQDRLATLRLNTDREK